MVVTLPLPPTITRYFPPKLVSILQWFAFWTFAVLLVIPWMMCVYRLTTTSLGRRKQIKHNLNEKTAPKTVVVMPVYKEHPDVLLLAINSVVNCEYPPACIHVFLSFDGDDIDELFLTTVDRLGVPVTMKDFPQSIDVAYNGARVTISRFPHGGKRHCQKMTFKLIDKIYERYLQRNDDLFILFIDSDCILDKVCIQNFMWEMELMPGKGEPMLAMTGVITATTEKRSLITLLQDMEYIHGQLFERSVESGCGSVTCLPGALTILRFSAFKNMAKYYFSDKAENCEDLFDYGKCHLGEDRWLTHLFMLGANHRYQIGMCTNAFCKTESVQTFRSLLKQRRRWFLGFITNEACMLTDARLWRQYPLLCIVRFMQNTIRTTALLFVIMVISLCTTSTKIKNLPVGFIAVSLGLNYLLMVYFGFKLRRFKAWLYPIMFVVNPFFNWIYIVYGIFTAGQRTWGGPRADAGAAGVKTSPQKAIEHAIATGDDLNVIPETFRPSVEIRKRRGRTTTVGLQPPEKVEGRFVPAAEQPGGWFKQGQMSESSLPQAFRSSRPGKVEEGHVSDFSDSDVVSLHTPRRLASILAEEEWLRRERTQSEPPAAYDSDGSGDSVELREDGTTRLTIYGRHSQVQDRRDRAVKSAGADPYELSRRLTDLAPPTLPTPPRATHDGTRSLRVPPSPLGKTSPMRPAGEIRIVFGGQDEAVSRVRVGDRQDGSDTRVPEEEDQSNAMSQGQRTPDLNSSRSKRKWKRLQKRGPHQR
jgi:chitin synthase